MDYCSFPCCRPVWTFLNNILRPIPLGPIPRTWPSSNQAQCELAITYNVFSYNEKIACIKFIDCKCLKVQLQPALTHNESNNIFYLLQTRSNVKTTVFYSCSKIAERFLSNLLSLFLGKLHLISRVLLMQTNLKFCPSSTLPFLPNKHSGSFS